MNHSLKKVCIQNAIQLAKKQQKPLGKLEEEIEVSAGYLSRLSKDDNTTKLTADLLVSLARALNVPIDELVYGAALLPNEQRIIDFIRKLEKAARNGELKWDKLSQATIAKAADFRYYNSGSTSCPIFDHNDHNLAYHSYFTEDAGTRQVGCFYRAALVSDTYVYLVKVQYPKAEQQDYELYFITPIDDYECSIEPVCGSSPVTEARFDRLLKSLYETISDTIDSIYFNPTVCDIIDKYMKAQNDDED